MRNLRSFAFISGSSLFKRSEEIKKSRMSEPKGAAGERKNGRGLEFISISPQRVLLPWLCVHCVLCGAVFHKNYILTATGS
jgi:hypothetical protein